MLTRPRTVAGHKGASPSRRPRGSRPSSAAGSSGVPKQLFTPGADDEQVLREGATAAESLFSHRLMHSLGDHSTTREGRSPASSVASSADSVVVPHGERARVALKVAARVAAEVRQREAAEVERLERRLDLASAASKDAVGAAVAAVIKEDDADRARRRAGQEKQAALERQWQQRMDAAVQAARQESEARAETTVERAVKETIRQCREVAAKEMAAARAASETEVAEAVQAASAVAEVHRSEAVAQEQQAAQDLRGLREAEQELQRNECELQAELRAALEAADAQKESEAVALRRLEAAAAEQNAAAEERLRLSTVESQAALEQAHASAAAALAAAESKGRDAAENARRETTQEWSERLDEAVRDLTPRRNAEEREEASAAAVAAQGTLASELQAAEAAAASAASQAATDAAEAQRSLQLAAEAREGAAAAATALESLRSECEELRGAKQQAEQQAQDAARAHAEDERLWNEFEEDYNRQTSELRRTRNAAQEDAAQARTAATEANARVAEEAAGARRLRASQGAELVRQRAVAGAVLVVVAVLAFCAGDATQPWGCGGAAPALSASEEGSPEVFGVFTVPPSGRDDQQQSVYSVTPVERTAENALDVWSDTQPESVPIVYRWHAPPFQECSSECGQSEVVQHRHLSCIAAAGDNEKIASSESNCGPAKPPARAVCPATPACATYEWVVSDGPVDCPCGLSESMQVRPAVCTAYDGNGSTVPALDAQCVGIKPRETYLCSWSESLSSCGVSLELLRVAVLLSAFPAGAMCFYLYSEQSEQREVNAELVRRVGDLQEVGNLQTQELEAAQADALERLAALDEMRAGWDRLEREKNEAEQCSARMAAEIEGRQRQEEEGEAAHRRELESLRSRCAELETLRAEGSTGVDDTRPSADGAGETRLAELQQRLTVSETQAAAAGHEHAAEVQRLEAKCATLEAQRQEAVEEADQCDKDAMEQLAKQRQRQKERDEKHKAELAALRSKARQQSEELEAMHDRCTELEVQTAIDAVADVTESDGEMTPGRSPRVRRQASLRQVMPRLRRLRTASSFRLWHSWCQRRRYVAWLSRQSAMRLQNRAVWSAFGRWVDAFRAVQKVAERAALEAKAEADAAAASEAALQIYAAVEEERKQQRAREESREREMEEQTVRVIEGARAEAAADAAREWSGRLDDAVRNAMQSRNADSDALVETAVADATRACRAEAASEVAAAQRACEAAAAQALEAAAAEAEAKLDRARIASEAAEDIAAAQRREAVAAARAEAQSELATTRTQCEAAVEGAADAAATAARACALRNFHSRRRRVCLGVATSVWRQHAVGCGRRRGLMLRALGRARARTSVLVVQEWAALVQRRSLRLRAAARTLRRLQNLKTARAFQSWNSSVQQLRMQRVKAQHADAVDMLGRKLDAEKMKVVAPRTQLHCRTCQCAPFATRQERRSSRTAKSDGAICPPATSERPQPSPNQSPSPLQSTAEQPPRGQVAAPSPAPAPPGPTPSPARSVREIARESLAAFKTPDKRKTGWRS